MGLTISEKPVVKVKQPPINLHLPEKKKSKIKSYSEAMVKLTHAYPKEVARGRDLARMIALEKGQVFAREVVNTMIEEGSFVSGAKKEHWISAIFRSKEWEWTGKLAVGKGGVKWQGGVRWSRIWRLKKHVEERLKKTGWICPEYP